MTSDYNQRPADLLELSLGGIEHVDTGRELDLPGRRKLSIAWPRPRAGSR